MTKLDDFLLGNYKTVAARLGLTVDGGFSQGHLRIVGVLDGVGVQMWFGSHATHTAAQLPYPPSIDFSVVTTSLMRRLAGLFGGGHATFGDAEFDKSFSVKSSDLSRLAAMFDADSRRVLIELAHEGLHPAVDPHTVHLRRFSNGGIDSEQVIERDFRETARLAKVLATSFARTP